MDMDHDLDLDHTVSSEGYSLLQKGLFFAFIMGCILVYLRMNGKKERYRRDKSLV